MKTFDDENMLFDIYINAKDDVVYFGNFCKCKRIHILTKSILFKKSWIDSSAKSVPPPDFHNDKHHIMMEFMRIDDCTREMNNSDAKSSFERSNLLAKSYLGKKYKKDLNGNLITSINTSNLEVFNINGYLYNFNKAIKRHEKRIDLYKKNHPLCKEVIFFIFDESNNYALKINTNAINYLTPHKWYLDSKFLNIIKNCKADYIIWYGYSKIILHNGKRIKLPNICIYDIKNLKENGIIYNYDSIIKLKEEEVKNGK